MNGPRRLRELFAGDRAVVAPGAFDCISARLIEQAGFPAIYMTGGGAAASQIGRPDVGLMTLTEMALHGHHLAMAVDIPVIADADTGYGNAMNVMRTIQEYKSAGIAGCHIEDQVTPKRCGHLAGKQIIDREEYLGKIRAAAAARGNPDFVIIARTDARAVVGLDEAIERVTRSLAAGADLAFVEAPESPEELAEIARRIPGPLAAVASSAKATTRQLTFADFEAMGYRLLIIPGACQMAAIAAIKSALAALREHGTLGPIAGQLASFSDFLQLTDLSAYQALERQFLPEPQRTAGTV